MDSNEPISVEVSSPEPTVSIDTIFIAAEDSSNHDNLELSFSKGDVLTVVGHSAKDKGTVVHGPDGSVGEVPQVCLQTRLPVALSPLPYYHQEGVSQEESERLLKEDGQFIVVPCENSDQCIILSRSEGVLRRYVVAVGTNSLLTVNGRNFFPSLPALIEFYSVNTDCIRHENVAVPVLREPVPISRGDMLYYIDQERLTNYWGLPGESIEKSKSIGKGEFGEVFAGTYRGNYQIAVKTLSNMTDDRISNGRLNLLREAAVMTHLRHKNLVQLVGVVFEDDSLQMIALELMSRGSLGKYLVSRGRAVVSQRELLQYARDVCEGMVYMSSQGFVHRDLAIRNVLLNSNGVAKVSDFGLSRPAYVHVDNEVGKFPVKWTAPEALKDRIFSEKSDVWSFGVLLWEIYSFGRAPYPSIFADEVLEQIEDGYLMDPPDGCPDGVYDLMTECWSLERKARPTFVAVREMLARSFGESRTPCSSPLLVRSIVEKTKQKVEKLLNDQIASEIYQKAPSDSETELHVGNIILVGPKGAGKTSLMRRFQGEDFREIEPSTTKVQFSEKFCEVVDHRSWRNSDNCLDYENELARCIVQQLLNHVQQLSPETLSPPLLPPLADINRRRSASFTYHGPSLPPRPPHMSLLVEDMTLSPIPVASFTESQPEGLNLSPPSSPTLKHRIIKRRLSLTKFFRRNSKEKSSNRAVGTKTISSPNLDTRFEKAKGHSPLLSANHVPFLRSDTPPNPRHHLSMSIIPELLKQKLRDKLADCVAGVLPPEFYIRFIDTPGFQKETFPSSCLLNSSSIVLAVLDSSKNRKELINDLAAKVNALFYGKNHSYLTAKQVTMPSPTVVLVGTHTDRTTMFQAKEYLDKAYKALKESGCGQYIASSSFLVSNSSILEQSSIDSVKSYIIELLKTRYRAKVPLKWLKCIQKVKQLSFNGQYMASLEETREAVEGCCDKDQCYPVIEFLHNNHVILHLEKVAPSNDIVFTDPKWFIDKLSSLFSLGHPSANVPAHLSNEHHMLQSEGIFSQVLLDEIWQCPKAFQQKMLFLMHQLEILCLRSVGSRPISPWESEHSLSSLSLHSTPPPPSPVITKVVIPSLIVDRLSEDMATPTYCLEPLFFKFSTQFLPPGLLHKLSIRCMQFYTGQYTLFNNGGCFTVDDTTVLMIQELSNSLKVILQPSHYSSEQPSISSDVAMTTLMFLRAAISDLITTWLHDSVTYELCIECGCNNGCGHHFLSLDKMDRHMSHNESLTCEQEENITSVPTLLRPWFGEDVTVVNSLADTDDELVNRRDIKVMVESLQDNRGEEPTDVLELANDKTLSFLDLISSLENIGRSDIADSLIDARMKTSGIAL